MGQPVPDYVTTTLRGDTLTLASLAGNVVLLNVWGEWCPPCIRKLPVLEGLHKRYAQEGLVVIGLHADTSPLNRIRKLADEAGVTFHVVPEGSQRAQALTDYGWGIPRTYLIDRTGLVLREWIGDIPIPEQEVRSALGLASEVS